MPQSYVKCRNATGILLCRLKLIWKRKHFHCIKASNAFWVCQAFLVLHRFSPFHSILSKLLVIWFVMMLRHLFVRLHLRSHFSFIGSDFVIENAKAKHFNWIITFNLLFAFRLRIKSAATLVHSECAACHFIFCGFSINCIQDDSIRIECNSKSVFVFVASFHYTIFHAIHQKRFGHYAVLSRVKS